MVAESELCFMMISGKSVCAAKKIVRLILFCATKKWNLESEANEIFWSSNNLEDVLVGKFVAEKNITSWTSSRRLASNLVLSEVKHSLYLFYSYPLMDINKEIINSRDAITLIHFNSESPLFATNVSFVVWTWFKEAYEPRIEKQNRPQRQFSFSLVQT